MYTSKASSTDCCYCFSVTRYDKANHDQQEQENHPRLHKWRQLQVSIVEQPRLYYSAHYCKKYGGNWSHWHSMQSDQELDRKDTVALICHHFTAEWETTPVTTVVGVAMDRAGQGTRCTWSMPPAWCNSEVCCLEWVGSLHRDSYSHTPTCLSHIYTSNMHAHACTCMFWPQTTPILENPIIQWNPHAILSTRTTHTTFMRLATRTYIWWGLAGSWGIKLCRHTRFCSCWTLSGILFWVLPPQHLRWIGQWKGLIYQSLHH